MKRKNHLPDAAEEFTHTAAERSADLRDAIVDAVTPLLEQAQDVFGPYVEQAQDKLEPIAHDTKKKGAAFAATALDKAQPGINDALDKVTPTVDAARVRMQEDLIPKLSEVLHTAAELPTVLAAMADDAPDAAEKLGRKGKKQLKKANKKARKAAKKDAKAFGKQSKHLQDNAVDTLQNLVPAKRHQGRNTFFGIVLAAGLIAGVVSIIKKYLGNDDEAGWTPHEASSAYTQSDSKPADVKPTQAAPDTHPTNTGYDASTTKEEISDAETEGMNTTPPPTPKTGQISEGQGAEGGADAAGAASSETTRKTEGQDADGINEKAEDAEPRDYGEGSFVGENPPAGYTIKGNERSMKYHVEGSGGYDRTIADVWFNSEETAEKAGFTKAQR